MNFLKILLLFCVLSAGCSTSQEQENVEAFAKRPKWIELDHKYFKVFYDPKIRLARYVTYVFDAEKHNGKKVKRGSWFKIDPQLKEKDIPHAKPVSILTPATIKDIWLPLTIFPTS